LNGCKHIRTLFLLATCAFILSGHSAEEPVVVWNGNFSDGGESPAQWDHEGKVTGARDTVVFKEGSSSLRVDAKGEKGSVFQWLDFGSAKKFTLKGFYKCVGAAKAQIVVQTIDAKWSKNDWKQIKYLNADEDWTSFEKEIELPEWAKKCRVMLHVEGTGQVWLDEISIGEKPPRAGRVLDPAKDEPVAGKPWEPAWCVWNWRSAWVGQHEKFVATTKKGGIDVVFYGDSITLGWKNRWDDAFAPLKAINYGIGGDSTRQLLWRIGNGEVEGLKPKLVVLAIGTNNLYGDKNAGSDTEIAKGIETVVKLLQTKLPESKILLVAILPRQNDFFCKRIKKINAQIAKLEDGKNIKFLNMWDAFMLTEPGTVKEELYVEKRGETLHPNAKGYDVMAGIIKPVIEEMLK